MTPRELADLIVADIDAALAITDIAERTAALRAAGRVAFTQAYQQVDGDPETFAIHAADFTNTLNGAMAATIPDGTGAQAERVAAIWATAATNAAAVAVSPPGGNPSLRRTWVTMEDDAVRDLHRPMHGVTIAAGERFNVGGFLLRYPGEPVGPPEVWINCRCTLAVGAATAAGAPDAPGDTEVGPSSPSCARGELDGLPTHDDTLVARSYNTDKRRQMASRGTAMPDGSFPIADIEDLRNAIQAIGRAKDPAKAKAHIRKRARALGATNLIPDSWTASVDPTDDDAVIAAPNTHDAPGWITNPRETQRLRTYWTKGAGAGKIRWGAPGDFDRCRKHLAKYVSNPSYLAGTCANLHFVALGFWPNQGPHAGKHHRRGGAEFDYDPETEEFATVATAFIAAAVAEDQETSLPMTEWFTDPGFDGPTPLTITSDGRVLGHLATWGTCHVGISGACTEAPRSRYDYAYFRTGETETASGEMVPVGQITMETGHAGTDLGPTAAVSHYDDTGTVVADVAAGEDGHGIWVAGAIRPGVSEDQLRALRAGSLSGDWRRIGGNLELVAALVVNVPGFPIPRTQVQMAASGAECSLVAAAIVERDPNAMTVERVAIAVNMALDDRDRARDRAQRARALRAEITASRVAALTAAVGVEP